MKQHRPSTPIYGAYLHKLPGMPALLYTWRIDRISLQTAPWIATPTAGGGTLLQRDETRLGYREIERTDAWADDEGRADYLLHCTLLDPTPVAPRR